MSRATRPSLPRAGGEDEFALIERVARRDRAAFEQLYLLYHRRLSRFLMRFADRYGLVEEIINDTLFTVWQKAAEFRGQSQVSTWIIGIAYRRALKALKRQDGSWRSQSEDDGPHPATVVEDSRSPEREMQDWVARGLAQLSVEHRLTLELTYFLGHSCEEVAEITGCPVNTVKTRMFHARQRLRKLLPELAAPTVPRV
ncbi:MAG: sigma-70 family RNA polymerase sigma factor [Nevskiales bacterium]